MTVPKKRGQTAAAGSSGKPTMVLRRVVSDAATADVENVLISTADPVSVAMRVMGAAERKP
jgi:hypothetical protein